MDLLRNRITVCYVRNCAERAREEGFPNPRYRRHWRRGLMPQHADRTWSISSRSGPQRCRIGSERPLNGGCSRHYWQTDLHSNGARGAVVAILRTYGRSSVFAATATPQRAQTAFRPLPSSEHRLANGRFPPRSFSVGMKLP